MDKIKYRSFFLISAIFLFIGFSNQSYAQRRRAREPVGYGAGIIYNFATEGFGAELRVKIPIRNRLSIVPEISYFPPSGFK